LAKGSGKQGTFERGKSSVGAGIEGVELGVIIGVRNLLLNNLVGGVTKRGV